MKNIQMTEEEGIVMLKALNYAIYKTKPKEEDGVDHFKMFANSIEVLNQSLGLVEEFAEMNRAQLLKQIEGEKAPFEFEDGSSVGGVVGENSICYKQTATNKVYGK